MLINYAPLALFSLPMVLSCHRTNEWVKFLKEESEAASRLEDDMKKKNLKGVISIQQAEQDAET